MLIRSWSLTAELSGSERAERVEWIRLQRMVSTHLFLHYGFTDLHKFRRIIRGDTDVFNQS